MTLLNVLGVLLAGLLPIAVLFCWTFALTGTTRPVVPALAGAACALAVAAFALLAALLGGVFDKEQQIFGLAQLILPPACFIGFFVRARLKGHAARSIPSNRRLLVLLFPAALGLVAGGEFALVCALAALVIMGGLCAVTGKIPAPAPLGTATLLCLNGVLFLSIAEILDLPDMLLLFMAAAFMAASVYIAFKPLEPCRRFLTHRLPANARMATAGITLAITAVCLTPVLHISATGLLPVMIAACAACAVSGNTRAIVPGIAGLAVAISCGLWVVGLGSIHMGAAGFVLLVLLGLPLAVFGGWYGVAVLAGFPAQTLPPVGRTAAAVAAVALLGVFLAALNL